MARIISTGRRVTLKAIAEQVGCAVSVVSTVLNEASGSTRVGPEMRRQIEGVARKLGYRPNYHARSLRTGKARAVGILLVSSGRFWQPVFAAATDHLLLHDYQVLCLGSHTRSRVIEELQAAIDDCRVDGLLIPGFGFGRTIAKRIGELPVPKVVVEGQAMKSCGHVRIDAASGIVAAVDHLAGLGHRRLAYVGPEEGSHSHVRRRSFLDRAAALGLQTDLLSSGEEGGERRMADLSAEALRRYCQGKKRATGLVCYNEWVAMAVYQVAAEQGLRVPRDISVVGFDDIHGEATRPAMTVVSHMLEEIGVAAAAEVLSLIDDPEARPREISLPAELVLRESTAAPPA